MASITLTLDDRIFCLQRTEQLPQELRDLVRKADVAFLQDRDVEATETISLVEHQCKEKGIEIFMPQFAGCF